MAEPKFPDLNVRWMSVPMQYDWDTSQFQHAIPLVGENAVRPGETSVCGVTALGGIWRTQSRKPPCTKCMDLTGRKPEPRSPLTPAVHLPPYERVKVPSKQELLDQTEELGEMLEATLDQLRKSHGLVEQLLEVSGPLVDAEVAKRRELAGAPAITQRASIYREQFLREWEADAPVVLVMDIVREHKLRPARMTGSQCACGTEFVHDAQWPDTFIRHVAETIVKALFPPTTAQPSAEASDSPVDQPPALVKYCSECGSTQPETGRTELHFKHCSHAYRPGTAILKTEHPSS